MQSYALMMHCIFYKMTIPTIPAKGHGRQKHADKFKFEDFQEKIDLGPQGVDFTVANAPDEGGNDTDPVNTGIQKATIILTLIGPPVYRIFIMQGKHPKGPPPKVEDWPLVRCGHLMSKMRIDFLDVTRIKHWDKRGVISLLSGNQTWRPDEGMAGFLENERNCIDAEAEQALKQLEGIDGRQCLVWTEPYKDERSVLLCIEPPSSASQIVTWENILNTGQIIEVENNDLLAL